MNNVRSFRVIALAATLVGAHMGAYGFGGEPEAGGGAGGAPELAPVRMPDEAEAHARTWMAYGATTSAWGSVGSYGVSRAVARKDLMRIAVNLSRFEPVTMLVSDAAEKAEAETWLAAVSAEGVTTAAATYAAGQVFSGGATLPVVGAHGVTMIIAPVNDLWMRDIGPVFVKDAVRHRYGVNFNFNGWGQEDTGAAGWAKDARKAANGIDDQDVSLDRRVADEVTKRAAVSRIDTWLVMEGGGIEVDGKGTALCTESCIINPNRNPNRTKSQIEAELKRVLGVAKVIWLPGRKAQDITDGHVDFYARFVGDSTVVYALDNDTSSPDHAVTRENRVILETATDSTGHRITAIPLVSPNSAVVKAAVLARNKATLTSVARFNDAVFAAGYVGFYVANGCVLMAQFGDPAADLAAFKVLEGVYPARKIVQISTDGLANGGGTIHCATQQEIDR